MVDAQRPVSQSPADGQASPFAADAVDDWPARASATVVQYVGTVRDKTTGPALVASRNAVYFLAMGLIAFVAVILLLLLSIRMLVSVTAYLPVVEPGESWMAYLILGGIFLLAGMILWRKKEVR
jgi:hypothetical protein